MFEKSLGYRKSLCIIEGITIFRRKLFVSQCRNFLWASLQGFRKFGVSKIFMHNRGYHKFPSKIFCLTVPINFVGIPSMFPKNLGYRKISCKIEGITIFRRKLFVSQCRNILWASLQCFGKFGVSKNFMHKRGYHKFPSKKFLSHSAEKFRGHPFNVSKKIGVSKSFMHNRGYHKFPSKNFCLTVLKNFVGIPSMFQKVWGIGKILCIIGGITSFRRKFFVSQCWKISWASLQCFRKFGVSEKFCA